MPTMRAPISIVNNSWNNPHFMKWKIAHLWWDSNPRPLDYMPGLPTPELRKCYTFGIYMENFTGCYVWYTRLLDNQLVSNRPLEWRHNQRDGVPNHRRPDCLLYHL